MSNEIIAAVNAAFPDGPASDPANPDKSAIRNAGVVIQSSVDAAASGILRADNLAQLNATPGTFVNQPGQVFNDGNAANNGEYRWTGSAWQRVGPLINTASLQQNIDRANAWAIFFNSGPLLLDQSGVVDGNAYLYVPTRKFYSKGVNAIDLDVGTAADGFPGYERVDIGRFRENAGAQPTFVYYDLDDVADPVKVTTYNTFPPGDRPARVVELITIFNNGFYSSPVKVIEISGTDGGQIWPLGAIVHEGGSVLIPAFYQYHWVGNAGVVTPADGRYFEFAATEDSTRRYYYDNISHQTGGTAVKEVLGNGYPRQEGHRIYKLAAKDNPINNNVIGFNGFRVADIVRNQWLEGKYPDSAARLFPLSVVNDSPAALVTAGFARCVKSTNSQIYYGGDIGFRASAKTKAFARFYVHTTAADNFGTTFLCHFWNDETFLGNFPLNLEKKVSSNLAIYSGYGLVQEGANHFYVGIDGATAGTHSVAGGQFWAGTEDETWIARDDYPLDVGSTRPIYGKDMWAVAGRPLPIYLQNLIGVRNESDLLAGGFHSLRGVDKYPHFVEGREQVVVNPDLCGNTGTLTVRRRGVGGDKQQRMASPVTINTSDPIKTGTKKVLFIGDSITNGGLARRVDIKLRTMGVVPTWLGTINSTDTYFNENATDGLPGEGRGGREFGDFTHALTVKMTVPTNPATYLAASKATKVGQNPFIRPSTGSDPANIIFNGYVFDFAYYIANFLAGVNPDIVVIGLGTNDREFQTDTVAVQNVSDGVRVMMGQIRAALPAAKIAWWMPPGPRSHSLDDGRWERGNKIMRACSSWILTSGDANMHIIPAWAHVSPEIGWWQNASPTVADNVTKSLLGDVIHFGPDPAPLREQLAEVLFAYIANQI
jgi:hypothetical protein